ncbi:MAG: HEAT repeat domain-containing protein [Nitrospirota bacterium]
MPLLKDGSSRVRSATARALGMAAGSDVLPALAERLQDDELPVRCYAAGALLRIMDEHHRRMETDENVL